MGRTRRELLDNTGADELAEWWEYNKLEPFGEERGDLRNGILCSLIAAAHGAKDSKPIDFMPDYGNEREERKQTPEDHLRIMQVFALAMGAKPENPGDGG